MGMAATTLVLVGVCNDDSYGFGLGGVAQAEHAEEQAVLWLRGGGGGGLHSFWAQIAPSALEVLQP